MRHLTFVTLLSAAGLSPEPESAWPHPSIDLRARASSRYGNSGLDRSDQRWE